MTHPLLTPRYEVSANGETVYLVLNGIRYSMKTYKETQPKNDMSLLKEQLLDIQKKLELLKRKL